MSAGFTPGPRRAVNVKARLVLVEWEDSSQPVAHWQFRDEVEVSTVRIASVGWLIKRTDTVIGLAPNVGGIGGDGTPQCSGVISIPSRAVLSLTVLNENPTVERPEKGGTIQQCLLAILRQQPNGIHINDLTDAIHPLYGRKLARVSVSPQLSRLKHRGLVELRDGLWFPASGMSASGQDPKGLEARPASPTAEGGDAQTPSERNSHDLS